MIGWTKHGDNSYYITLERADGQHHVIVVAELVDGWSFKWQRGVGMTLQEHSGYKTLEEAITALWGFVFDQTDRYVQLTVEDARRRLGMNHG